MPASGKAGAPGKDYVPPRIAYILNRKELTGKTTTRQKNALDNHFLLQREYQYKAEAEAREAKRNKD